MRKRNYTVTIRMNKEEYNLLQSKVKESGRTQQEVVIKAIADLKIASTEEVEELKRLNQLFADILSQLRGATTNINQIARKLHTDGEGDIGFVFPDIIHHYQVLTPGVNKATYLIASPFTIGKFAEIMQTMAPEYPVIKAEKVEPEVYRVINAILETKQFDIIVAQAYLQIVLARCVGKLNLVEKSHVGSKDLIYQTVSYISANFKKKLSLEEMAKDLGVSKYVLSRLFSKTFHRNFNQYLNDARLNYACHRLENTSDSITNICLDSGFESRAASFRLLSCAHRSNPARFPVLT